MENHIVEIVEFLLLLFIAMLWYLAWRSLTATAIQKQVPAVAELKELRETIEHLIAILEERATSAETRLQEAEERLGALIEEANAIRLQALVPPPLQPAPAPEPAALVDEEADESRGPEVEPDSPGDAKPPAVEAAPQVALPVRPRNRDKKTIRRPAPPKVELPAPDPKPVETEPERKDPYARVYELIDSGITDRVEIARRTGFGLSEIELVLTMRPRI